MKTQNADTFARVRRTSWNRLRRLAAARDIGPGVLLNQILASHRAVRAALAVLDRQDGPIQGVDTDNDTFSRA